MTQLKLDKDNVGRAHSKWIIPSPSEGVVQFLLRHPAWPLRSRLFVAEAHQEHPTARLQDRRQSRNVLCPVLIGNDVEQAAVDHVGEALGPVLEG
jgi:hypothetical protein